MPSLASRTAAETGRWSRRQFVYGLLGLICAASLFGVFRPRSITPVSTDEERAQTCLSNLSRIAQAFVQYAEDYDGRFPRGVDPEDRNNPQVWAQDRIFSRNYNAPDLAVRDFSIDAQTAPLLHQLLGAYIGEPAVWHCPADSGWSDSSLTNLGGSLRDVAPSSYAKFGTSYYYLTVRGFLGVRAADFAEPGRAITLFDGDMWHPAGERKSINVLFADGHAQNLTAQQFHSLMRRSDLQEATPRALHSR